MKIKIHISKYVSAAKAEMRGKFIAHIFKLEKRKDLQSIREVFNAGN